MKGFGLYLIITLLLLSAVTYMLSTGNKSQEVQYSEVVSMFEREQVQAFEYNDGTLHLVLNDGKNTKLTAKVPYLDLFYADLGKLIDEQREAGILKEYTYKTVEMPWWASFVPYLIVLVLFGLLWYFMMNKQGGGGGSPMQFGRARVKMASDDKKKVTFDDVAGADEEKAELQEIVEFLKNPRKFIDIGARIPKGVLLVGPPGTGKTLIAKAVAGEAGVPFLSISGSDFVELYVGVGASRVRDLFEQAKKSAPAIVFIDEIDAVGRQRGAGLGGGHDEREQTLNQLLVEMDGFGVNEGVIVIAATNRKDILDNALLRPGRFDRQVYVGAPDVVGREAILKVHARGKQFDPDVDFKSIAKTTTGFTGADLENLLNEAALLAARRNKKFITTEEIEQSLLKVVMGVEKRTRIVNEEDQKLTAYHEAGHAIAFHVLPTQDPVHHVTIIPRSNGAGGFTMPLPKEDNAYRTRRYMEEHLIVCLAGRVAEEIFMDDISTGAYGDIKQATAMARAMVINYGFSDKIGPIDYDAQGGEIFLGRDFAAGQGYSDAKAAEIDEEIHRLIQEANTRCRKLLEDNREQLTRVAEYLRRNETIDGEIFRKLYDGEEVADRTAPSERELKGVNVDITLEADSEEVLAAQKQDTIVPEKEEQKEDPALDKEQDTASTEDTQK
ncbi:MAG: ATP-dependent zinc metalloprotease FtsH [Butyricicoccus pullicaecorum]|nr:ATP-dependent zinc metalloprotease FtsH [Butyricicoccus pullicaecorum]